MIQLSRVEAVIAALGYILAGVIFGAPVGLWYGGRHAAAIGDAKLAELRQQTAEASAKSIQAAADRLAAETARGNRLSAGLVEAEAKADALSHQLQTRVDRVTTAYREAPGAVLKPVPQCIFTRGWLRDYNAAIGAAVPASAEATGAPTQAPATGSAAAGDDELVAAGIDPRSILKHHIGYGTSCTKLEAQLNSLIDYEEGKDVQ